MHEPRKQQRSARLLYLAAKRDLAGVYNMQYLVSLYIVRTFLSAVATTIMAPLVSMEYALSERFTTAAGVDVRVSQNLTVRSLRCARRTGAERAHHSEQLTAFLFTSINNRTVTKDNRTRAWQPSAIQSTIHSHQHHETHPRGKRRKCEDAPCARTSSFATAAAGKKGRQEQPALWQPDNLHNSPKILYGAQSPELIPYI